jgi:hypothetical protein
MGVFMNATLTYDDLAEAAAFMADRLIAAQNQVLGLSQQLAAAHCQVAALQGALDVEQERCRELRVRGDYWQSLAAETLPRLGHFPAVASASPLSLLRKLWRASRPAWV